MIRIAIAGDDRLHGEGLRAILSAIPGFSVVGRADGPGVGPLIEANDPDILLVESHMAGVLELCTRMHRLGHPRPILLSVDGDDGWSALALESGARGLLRQSACPAALEKAIRVVHEGQIWAPHLVLDQVIEDAAAGRKDREKHRRPALGRLSGRELEVLRHAGEGLSNKEIAGCLGIRPATVKAHLTRVFQKLGLRDRLQLAVRYGAHPRLDSLPGAGPDRRTTGAETPPRVVRRPT
jgi:DNA-binding NarL/FixJ family response regulator